MVIGHKVLKQQLWLCMVLSVMKIIGFQNSAAVDETWIRAYSAPFPDRESCIGGIEFPLDVHYSRIRKYVMGGTVSAVIAVLSVLLLMSLQNQVVFVYFTATVKRCCVIYG